VDDGRDLLLDVTLVGVHPRVFRRLQVPADTRLDELHEILQAALGWSDVHLHLFDIGGVSYTAAGEDEDGEDEDGEDEDEAEHTVGELVDPDDRFCYVYDFGDEWRHQIVVAGSVAADPAQPGPRCLDGTGATPAEDSGGPSALRTVGGTFSLEAVNAALSRSAPR
jgi:hypothetical protein